LDARPVKYVVPGYTLSHTLPVHVVELAAAGAAVDVCTLLHTSSVQAPGVFGQVTVSAASSLRMRIVAGAPYPFLSVTHAVSILFLAARAFIPAF
jgi:hypothetical protein